MNTEQTREALERADEELDSASRADEVEMTDDFDDRRVAAAKAWEAALAEHERAIRAEAAREAAKEVLNAVHVARLSKYWAERSLVFDKDAVRFAVENALTEVGDMITDRAARIEEGKA